MRILYTPTSLSQQRQFQKTNVNIFPIRLAMEASYYEEQRIHEVTWNEKTNVQYDKIITEPEGIPFLSLPHPNRHLTRAMDPIYQRNGNFKYHPGTYIQSASGCSYGRCVFCVENGKPYEVRPVEDVMSELQEIRHMKYKEAFDDSATFPTGKWLEEFCKFRIAVKDPLILSCNMRIDAKVDYSLLKKANFRMLLYGVESANQATLDRIGKGIRTDDIIPTLKKASECGLENHVAVMFGFPWETDADALATLRLVHYLLRKGFCKTAQASFYTPKEGGGKESQRKFVKKIYDVGFRPSFWFRKLADIRNFNDIRYIMRGIKSWCA